ALEPFALSQDGDDIVISSATAAGVLTGYDHEVHFEASEPLRTFGRYVKADGSADYVALASPTPGAANSSPVIGPAVINEIMYHPASGQDEYIELRNITGQSVPLYDPSNPSNPWKFTDGIDFAFPAGATLAASAFALVVPIDPATFRSKYNIPASVPIYGPYL